jgi:hypothetical protein
MMLAPIGTSRRAIRSSSNVRAVARAAGAARPAIEFADLLDVIKAVDSSDVIEMELNGKNFSVSVKKQEALGPVIVQAPTAGAPLDRAFSLSM